MCGYKAGTHITLNDQLPDGVRHGQKLSKGKCGNFTSQDISNIKGV